MCRGRPDVMRGDRDAHLIKCAIYTHLMRVLFTYQEECDNTAINLLRKPDAHRSVSYLGLHMCPRAITPNCATVIVRQVFLTELH